MACQCCVYNNQATINLADPCVCNANIGSTLVTSTGAIYVRTTASNPCALTDWTLSTGGINNITLADAFTNTQPLVTNDTITFIGQNGADVKVSATDTVTVDGLFKFGAGAPVANPTITTQTNSYYDCTNNQLYIWCPTSGAWNTANSFTLSDGTTTQQIKGGDTLTVTGTNGVKATVSATDTLTINGLTTFSAVAPVAAPTVTTEVNFHLDTANNQLYQWNPTSATWNKVGAPFSITDGTTTEIVNSGDTVTFQGLDGVRTTVSATDTVSIYGLTTFGAGAPVGVPVENTQVNLYVDTTANKFYAWNPTSASWQVMTLAMNDLSDADTVTNPPVTNQPLMWNGTNWTPIDATCPATTQATTFLGYDGTNYGWMKPRQVLNYRYIAANGTLIPATDGVIAIDASAGSRTFTLVAPAACDPQDFYIKRYDSTVVNTVTISATLIDGALSVNLTTPGPFSTSSGEAIHIIHIGGNAWLII